MVEVDMGIPSHACEVSCRVRAEAARPLSRLHPEDRMSARMWVPHSCPVCLGTAASAGRIRRPTRRAGRTPHEELPHDGRARSRRGWQNAAILIQACQHVDPLTPGTGAGVAPERLAG